MGFFGGVACTLHTDFAEGAVSDAIGRVVRDSASNDKELELFDTFASVEEADAAVRHLVVSGEDNDFRNRKIEGRGLEHPAIEIDATLDPGHEVVHRVIVRVNDVSRSLVYLAKSP